MAQPIGITVPLAKTTSSLGYVAFSTREIEAAYYNLKALLLTNWGERPNHYYLGCNLIEFIFQPVSQETYDAITARITSQVASWLPYIVINDIGITVSGPNGQTLNIRIDFGIQGNVDLNNELEISIQPQ